MAGFRTSEQTPFDIEMRFTTNKLLSCRYNMDTNRVEARFEDSIPLAINCITVEDVTRELEKRHVIDHKVKQERMQ